MDDGIVGAKVESTEVRSYRSGTNNGAHQNYSCSEYQGERNITTLCFRKWKKENNSLCVYSVLRDTLVHFNQDLEFFIHKLRVREAINLLLLGKQNQNKIQLLLHNTCL